MKKIIAIFTIIICLTLPAIAVNVSSALNDIESNLFGYEYNNEKDITRIERIEMQLYGDKKQGNIQKRLETIQNDMGIVSAEERQLHQKKQEEELAKAAPKAPVSDLKEDDSVEYPLVDKMENELFGKTFKKENIYNRLTRLEQTVFNQTNNDSLNNRVDKLASVIIPQKMKKITSPEYQDKSSLYENENFAQMDNQSVPFQLAVIEQDILKKIYDRDDTFSRLNRLEEKMFNRTFPTDTDINRLQRVMVAYSAQQDSYKYENNKKIQNMATMSQLGSLLLMILAILI